MRNSVQFPRLLRAPVFRDLPDDYKIHLIDNCSVRTFDKPTYVLSQGDQVHGMYIVADGSVEITNINQDGQTVLIHLNRQSEVFGDIDMLAEMPAAANCIATSNTSLLFCSKQQIYEALKSRIFLRNIMKASYDRLVRDNTVKFVDQFYPVEQRICDYLYRLSADRLEISKTQADLAGLLGCARQTLNRELGRLRDREIIMMQKGKIRVINRTALFLQATSGFLQATSGDENTLED